MDRKPIKTLAVRGGKRGSAGLRRFAALLAVLTVPAEGQAQYAGAPPPPPRPLPAPAATPTPTPDRTQETMDRAGEIAVQPAKDVGIVRSGDIPLVLQEAVKNPYQPLHRQTCPWVDYELARLNQALGPDFGTDPKGNEDKATKIALAGGEMIIGGLIPFRGIVREISGAAPAERRKTAAVNAGLARRGYVRGVGMVLACPARVTTAAK